jgi:hypothetical protein
MAHFQTTSELKTGFLNNLRIIGVLAIEDMPLGIARDGLVLYPAA